MSTSTIIAIIVVAVVLVVAIGIFIKKCNK